MIDRTVEILGRLVAFPTVSSAPNLDLVDYVTDLLSGVGGRVEVTHDETGSKANVWATLGPEGDGGVVLSGHTDVVPVEGQTWTRPPFEASVSEGRVWGRGTTDMKGFIACALAAAPLMAATNLSRPVHFALTFDEEEGCRGAKIMLEALRSTGIRPAAAIVGEPTDLEVIVAHKGCYEFTTRFTGSERHGSLSGGGAGAMNAAARFITMLDGLATRLADHAPVDSPFHPPGSSVNVGTIRGGVARNITAGSVEIEWELRPVVADDTRLVTTAMERFVDEVLLPDMRKEYAEAEVITTTVGAVGGLVADDSSAAASLARRLTGQDEVGVVPFGTEAGLYQEAGIPAVVWGPGSLHQAHKPDEFVEITQLEGCLDVLVRLVGELSEG